MGAKNFPEVFGEATAKQLEVLDLAADGLTSKQIAIDLSIAPRTVDQRIDALRGKLDGVARNDLVREYRHWKGVCGRTTYDRTPLTSAELEKALEVRQSGDELVFQDSLTFDGRASWDRDRSWKPPGLRPAELSAVSKILLMLAGAVLLISVAVLSVSFSAGLMALLER